MKMEMQMEKVPLFCVFKTRGAFVLSTRRSAAQDDARYQHTESADDVDSFIVHALSDTGRVLCPLLSDDLIRPCGSAAMSSVSMNLKSFIGFRDH